MLLGFKTELKLNNAQRTELASHAGVARHAWNWGLRLTLEILENNKLNPDEKIKFPTAIDPKLSLGLVAVVKRENPWYYESSKCAPQYALRFLADAWTRCFKKKGGRPKFKKKGLSDSFTLDGSIKVDLFKVKVPVIGCLKTYERLPDLANPKSVTISKRANRWFISFKIEVDPNPKPAAEEELAVAERAAGLARSATTSRFLSLSKSQGVDLPTPALSLPVVGIDLGIKALATLSSGEVFKGARSYLQYEQRLIQWQWLSRHKQIGSKNWRKAQNRIAKLHFKITNIRKDTLHKLTTYLAKNHSQVVVEDLNVSGMLANRKLAKAIQDMGFYEFRRQLEYKCQLYGSKKSDSRSLVCVL